MAKKTVTLNLTEEEFKKLKEKAGEMGLTVSAYIRYASIYKGQKNANR